MTIAQELKEMLDTHDWNDDIPLDESILILMDEAYKLGLGQITTRKPVVKLSMKGQIIKRYEKGINSVREDGYDPACVRKCCNGKQNCHKNFMWFFESEY